MKSAGVYWGIFLRTAGWLALAALVAAQGYDWANEQFVGNSSVIGWSLLGAAVAGVLAVAWAYVGSPATTAVGKALRQAVQVALGLPIAGVVLDSTGDFVSLGDLIVPSLCATVLAFVVTLLANRVPPPVATEPVPVTKDFAG